jgi:hypothetical protein
LDVGHQRDKSRVLALEVLDGFLPAGADRDREAGLFERILNYML